MAEVSSLGNLPVPLTTFVGRRVEMREVCARLERNRLVTVIGVGGCGKSRLAVETAASIRGEFRDGVWLVELASINDPSLVPDVVAATLRVAQPVGSSLPDTLISRISPCELLLVLDNCEHLVGAVADLVEHLLESAPGLRVLATSRERLWITGETLWRVPGLRVPSEGVGDVSALSEFDAVQLFSDRATAIEQEFRLSSANAAAVATICRRLDGLPLAIELAAARVSSRGVESVSAGMDDPFHLLTSGSRTASPRHQTLTAVVEWSYALLDEWQQVIFDRLSVFVGGFTLDAAKAVCADSRQGDTVAEAVSALVDKSLVAAESVVEGTTRYRLLDTLRTYGADHLTARGEVVGLKERHAHEMLLMAEHSWAAFRGPGQKEWLQRLELEHGNIRAALDFSIHRGDGEAAQALAGAVAPFWDLHGHYGEGRQWLTLALALESPANATRVRALNGLASLTLIQGDFDSAIDTFQTAAEVARGCTDEGGSAYALQYLALASIYAEDLGHAQLLIDESLDAAQRVGDAWLVGWAFIFRCVIELERSDFDQAATSAAAAHEWLEATGEPEGLAWSALGEGAAAWSRGQLEVARVHLVEGLYGFWELGGSWGLSMALSLSAQFAGSRDRWDRCVSLLAAAESLRISLGVALFSFIDRWQVTAIDEARSMLGAARFDDSWRDGTEWSLEVAAGQAAEVLEVSLPGAGHVEVPAVKASTVAPGRGQPARHGTREAVLRRNGEYWTVAFEGPAFRLKDTLGLSYLARLVVSPDHEFHVLDLAIVDRDDLATRAALRGDAGPVLDATAKANYRRRLQDLASELEEAESWSDLGRANRARQEIDALTDQLAAAVGLGGRDRRAVSAADRVRVNVTKAIRSAIRRIAEHDVQLAQHLDRSVRTGTFCSYAPDAAAEVHWRT
jgi:non-specific serine/threonine protein kinase